MHDSFFVKGRTMLQLYSCAQVHESEYFFMCGKSRQTGREQSFSPQKGPGSP